MSSAELRWEDFQKELVCLDDVSELSIAMKSLRERSMIKLSENIEELRKIDPDNPAFLPISLLGILHGTGLRETAHTRLLAWIFDPNKSKHEHGLPDDLFIPVIEWVYSEDKSEWPSGKYRVKRVEAERCTDENKRIDLWLEGEVKKSNGTIQEWLVVIEAKVTADPHGQQFAFYEEAARLWHNNSHARLIPRFIYLKDGKPADDKFYTKETWKPLSFLQLFEIIWPKIKDLTSAHGYHLVRYYLAGILSDIQKWKLPLMLPGNGLDYQMIGFSRYLIESAQGDK